MTRFAYFLPVMMVLVFSSVRLTTNTGESLNTIASFRADTIYDQLSDDQKRSPKFATAGLSTAPGVQVSLFASEPMVANPTVIDIDHKGRVWVCEANNYRPAITGRNADPAGDRILILEDTDGDGKADKSTVFYQDPELNAPIGLWVDGNRAIVSQSPYVWLLSDTDGDDVADKKEVIFSGIEGEQHDHGIHSFVMGPDGKFYFAVGNEGKQLLGKNGEPIRDKNNRVIDFKRYKQGLLLRCNTDFTDIEILGQNFRNNYEPAVDSYGNIWQSDNDDDGNRGVRINFILEQGNYGYTNELTGAGWRVKRTNMEDSIPFRHWHLNDPGVVPNLLQTGAGSPTGLIYYEGDLLPEAFRNQIIHCDAGPNVVRAYPVKKSGAGFTAETINLLKGTGDQWFRPSDVATAPDGSLFVSDWYDPGVGGHQMGDTTRGRIFRLAPDIARYTPPSCDYQTIESAVDLLANPNLSVRHHAFTTLTNRREEAIPALTKLFNNQSADLRLRARAFWILAFIIPHDDLLWESASRHPEPDIRLTILRAARQTKRDNSSMWLQMAEDKDPQVRREVAISLHGRRGPDVTTAWVKVANRYPAGDRWYLEALGIGAEQNWDTLFEAWLTSNTSRVTATQSGKDIVWRARTSKSVPFLAALAADNGRPLQERLRYFRAFDFNPGGNEKSEALMAILENNTSSREDIAQLALSHLDPQFVRQNPKAADALQKLLDSSYGSDDYIELVRRFEPARENNRLLALALSKPYETLGRAAASQLLRQDGLRLVEEVLESADTQQQIALVASISRIGSEASIKVLEKNCLDEQRPLALRRASVRAMAGSMKGEDILLAYLRDKRLEGELQATTIQSLSNTWRKAVRKEAASYLDNDKNTLQQHPPVQQLIGRKGTVENGKLLFTQYCSVCHRVESEGADFGPALSEIGDKLSRDGQYLAIYYPSAGISFGYEGYEITFKDGTQTAGIIASRTETDLLIKFPGGGSEEYKMSNVKSIRQMDESMMTPDLQDAMTTEELVDLVEYLVSLKK